MSPSLRPRLRRGAFALIVALLGLVAALAPAPSYAHTDLVSSTPEAGEALDALPGEVVLTFSEQIGEPAYVVVRTPDGTTYEDGAALVDGTEVTQPLVATDVGGKVTIAYRVVSADGHAVTGEYDVTVAGAAPPPAAPTEEAAAPDSSSGVNPALLVALGVLAAIAVAGLVVMARISRGRQT